MPNRGRVLLVGSGVFAALVVVVALWSLIGLREEENPNLVDAQVSAPGKEKPLPKTKDLTADTPKLEEPESPLTVRSASFSLKSDQPTVEELQRLLQGWLDGKAAVLNGEGTAQTTLQAIARPVLIDQVQQQRDADQAAGLKQSIEASIRSVQLISETPQRIALRAELDYRDQTTNREGRVVDQTKPSAFPLTYIFGRDDDGGWRLQAYQRAVCS